MEYYIHFSDIYIKHFCCSLPLNIKIFLSNSLHYIGLFWITYIFFISFLINFSNRFPPANHKENNDYSSFFQIRHRKIHTQFSSHFQSSFFSNTLNFHSLFFWLFYQLKLKEIPGFTGKTHRLNQNYF